MGTGHGAWRMGERIYGHGAWRMAHGRKYVWVNLFSERASITALISLFRTTNTLCPMPHALCPMPHASCLMPHAPCPMPYAPCPFVKLS